MKICKKILLPALFLSAAAAAFAVECVPGVRGNAARIRGDEEYLCDTKIKQFDFKKGVIVGKVPSDRIVKTLTEEIERM